MTERQAFGLLVRVLGVVLVIDGLKQLWLLFMRLFVPAYVFHYPLYQDFAYTLLELVLGSMLARSPGWAIRLAWPEESRSSS